MFHCALMGVTLLVVGAAPAAAIATPCPEGTASQGRAPPDGTGQWCERPDGAREGPFRAWYGSGDIKVRGRYEDGKKSGKWRYYYADGTPKAAGTFVAGVMQGLWTWWYEDGRPAEEGELTDGLEDGPWVFWHESGRVSESGVMRHGAREGWWREWAPDGELERMVRYEHGVEVDQRDQDSSRFRGYGGLYSCWGYDCGAWYRQCYAGWCDPFWDPYYRGYGFGYGYYGGYPPAYRVYPGRGSDRPQPSVPPSGLEPNRKKRKSYGPPEPPVREMTPSRRVIEPKSDGVRRRHP